MGLISFFKKAFSDMKKSAASQHEADKAEFQAAKASARANFEENRGRNSFARAKADAKRHWDDAHMSPEERAEAARAENEKRIQAANEKIAAANEKYEKYKK